MPITGQGHQKRVHMKSLTVSSRLRLTALAVTLLMSGIAAYTGWAFFNASIDQRLATTRSFVGQGVAIAQKYADAARSGQLTDAAAKAKAAADIKALRYDGSEYVWVNDMQPRMVMHPLKPEMDGTDLSNYKDPNGVKLFVEMAATVRTSGSGYVDYQWSKPGNSEPVPKRSYVAGFAPWGWVIGSGVYVDVARAAAVRFAAVSLALGLVGGLAVLVFVETLAGSIRRRLHAVDSALRRIASGDLTQPMASDRDDEIGRLIDAVDRTRESLAHVVSQVRSSTDNIANASSEIATGNFDLSSRTEETSSNLQRTASSMEQLTGTVRQSADAAAQANQLVSSASLVAERGGVVVSQVVTTMDEISAASRKISDIIGVIDAIAFQTNILALNAAVEAARAGEQGRGFAVVASEVRTLAQRSAAAAKEISGLIGSSVERVESGGRLVTAAGATMTEIVASVRRVSDIVGEITVATREQSSGLGQVNNSVGELDRMTQQNAALVEQSEAAAGSLKEQAARLTSLVSTFKLAA